MSLQLDLSLAAPYKSQSQKTRVMTEFWMLHNGFCPTCGNSLKSALNNAQVLDFDCILCSNQYELKSHHGNFSRKVTDGAYASMMKRITDINSPHFFFLSYSATYSVTNCFVVPNYFFQPSTIEKRKPLSATAKRAGWVGCNILLNQIPDIGKIKLIENSVIIEPKTVQKNWQKTAFLRGQKGIETRGWTLDVMKCIEQLNLTSFNLQQLYTYETYLSQRHPENHHVKDKIRQQLQFLRDKGFIEFEGRGFYKLNSG